MSEALERARRGCGACAVRNQENCSDCIESLLQEIDWLCEQLSPAPPQGDPGEQFLATLESLHSGPEVMEAARRAVQESR